MKERRKGREVRQKKIGEKRRTEIERKTARKNPSERERKKK